MDLHFFKIIVLYTVVFKFLKGFGSGASLSSNEMGKPYSYDTKGDYELKNESMDGLDNGVYDGYSKHKSYPRKAKFYGLREHGYSRRLFRTKPSRKSSTPSLLGELSPSENSKISVSFHEPKENIYKTGHQIQIIPLNDAEGRTKLETEESFLNPHEDFFAPPSYVTERYKLADLESASEFIPKSSKILASKDAKEKSSSADISADLNTFHEIGGNFVSETRKNKADQNLMNKQTFKNDKISNNSNRYMPSVLFYSNENANSNLETNIPLKHKSEISLVNFDAENDLTVDGPENSLTEPFEGSGDFKAVDDDEPDENTQKKVPLPSKSVRIIDFFARVNSSSTCTTPNGNNGQCRPFRDCLLSDALNNFNLFLQYVCLLQGTFVGVCCPDNPVIEISDASSDNITESVTANITQPSEGCGLNTNVRIVGGSVSLPHEWTWMVALLRRNRFFCGGVIINDWYILTAAHCVMGMKVNDLKIRLGEYNFQEQNEHQQDIPVAEIKRHAQFVTLTFQHDIALLKLKRRIEYSKFVGSICLPSKAGRDYSDANATVVGWGTVSFGGAASPVLRQVTIPVWKNEECDKTYRMESITDAFMCAGSPKNGEDACQGDSGGPLMALNDEGRWEVIGIVSWGRRCGDPVYPGVYTRVTSYLNWITENSQ